TNVFHDVTTFLTRLGEIGTRVCKVEIRSQGSETSGTGFLLGPDLVMTNYHVMERVIEERGVQPSDVGIRFDYKRLNNGKVLNPGTVYRLARDWLVDSSPPSPFERGQAPAYAPPQPEALDFALLRVDGRPGANPRKWIEIPSGSHEFIEGTPLFIVQHPQGAPLQLALDTEAIIGPNENGTRVRYRTNTEPGSSGSPCFNADWELVALHHSGDPNFDRDNKPEYNQGIPFRLIAARLNRLDGLAGAPRTAPRRTTDRSALRLAAFGEPIAAERYTGPKLVVALRETKVTVTPGNAVTIQCALYNHSNIVDEYRLAIAGIDPTWVELQATTERVFPPASTDGNATPLVVAMTFALPRTARAAVREYPFVLTAASVDDPGVTATANGLLIVGPIVDFALDVDDPAPDPGRLEGVLTVALRNTGNARLTIALAAEEKEGRLDCHIAEERVTLDAGQARQVALTTRLRDPRLGAAGVCQISVMATVVDVNPPLDLPPAATTRTALVTYRYEVPTLDPPALDPQLVELDDAAAQTRVVLGNRAAFPIVVELHGDDRANVLRFEWGDGDRVEVPARQVLRAPLRITCPDRSRLNPSPQATPFTVVVTPVAPAGAPATIQGDLRTPPPVDFDLRLEPEQVALGGEAARIDIVLTNRGARPTHVVLDAYDKTGALDLDFDGGSLHALPARGEPVTVQLRITLIDRARLPQPAGSTGFTVTATLAPPAGEPRVARGEVVISAPPDVRVGLDPDRVEGSGVQQVRLIVENQASRPAEFAIETSSRDRALDVAVESSRVTVAAQGRTTVPIQLTPRVGGGVGGPAAAPQERSFTVTVTPIEAPALAKEVSGRYALLPDIVSVRLEPEEIEAVGAATFDVWLKNSGVTDAIVALEAEDQGGGCGLACDPPRVTIAPGRSVRTRLIVTPPAGQATGARCQFAMVARPILPAGGAVRAEGAAVLLPARPRGRRLLWGILVTIAVWLLGIALDALFDSDGTIIFIAILLGPIVGGLVTRAWKVLTAYILTVIAIILALVLALFWIIRSI
ncbi:MAG: trypsin-like peptidase domain-containing protein, partial [Thermomicrobiales bacterium]